MRTSIQIIPGVIPALAAVSAMAAGSAMAQKAGDNYLGVGVAAIRPDASLGPLSSSGVNAAAFTAATAGASADVSNEVTVSLGWLHLFTDRVGAEFTLGIPPEHTIDLATPSPFAGAASHPGAATVRTWTPAAVAKYFFNAPGDRWRPYLGLGVSHVSFHDIEVNRADPLVVQVGGQSVSLSSRWTPVYNAGVVYHVNDRWMVNASVAYLPIKTTATLVGAGGTTTRGELKLRTTDVVVRVGYRF